LKNIEEAPNNKYDTIVQYKNDAWMRRTIDETVKNLAENGVETLKIPYGPTIAKIE